MRLMKNIVLAIDFSEGSSDAARATISLARRLHADVAPVHVIPQWALKTTDKDELRKAIDARLKKIAGARIEEGPNIADTEVLVGTPFEQIISFAESQGAGGIVMAARGRPEANSRGIGVTASRIVRHSTIPVLLIRKGCAAQIKRILCPVDMSSSSARALRNAAHLARAFEAELTVATVLKASKWPGVVSSREPKAEIVQDAINRRAEALDKFLDEFDLNDIKVDRRVIEGDPYEQISKTVDEEHFDLLAMGTVGRGRVARLLIGGVAERLTRKPPCALLVVKSRNIVQPQLEKDLKTIKDTFERAVSLLDKGFADEAIHELKKVTTRDRFYVPAWEALAAAYSRIGDEARAQRSADNARQILDSIYSMQVRAEARERWTHKS